MSNWSKKTIVPKNQEYLKLRYPSPGFSYILGVVCFLVIFVGIYYGGVALLGLDRVEHSTQTWTWKHTGLLTVGLLLGILGFSLIGNYAMTINIQSELLNYFFSILVYNMLLGLFACILVYSISMTILLGKEEAESIIFQYGMEQASTKIFTAAFINGGLLSIVYFLSWILKKRLISFYLVSSFFSIQVAKWYFSSYGIEGPFIILGLITPLLSLIFTPILIKRDIRWRRIWMEVGDNV